VRPCASPPPPLIGMNHLYPTRGSAEAGSAKATAGPTASAFGSLKNERKSIVPCSHAASIAIPAAGDTAAVYTSTRGICPFIVDRQMAAILIFFEFDRQLPFIRARRLEMILECLTCKTGIFSPVLNRSELQKKSPTNQLNRPTDAFPVDRRPEGRLPNPPTHQEKIHPPTGNCRKLHTHSLSLFFENKGICIHGAAATPASAVRRPFACIGRHRAPPSPSVRAAAATGPLASQPLCRWPADIEL
jgi:hypothetical protein